VDDRHPSLAVGPVLGRALVEFWLAVSGLLGRLADIRRCCEMPFCRWAYQTTRRAIFLSYKRKKQSRPQVPVEPLPYWIALLYSAAVQQKRNPGHVAFRLDMSLIIQILFPNLWKLDQH